MDYEACFPSRFLKAADLQGKEHTVKIGAIKLEKMPDGKTKGIISFEGASREWLLNRTNAESVVAMFGRDTDEWIGKRLTLFPQTVEAFGDRVAAVRVKGSPDITAPISKKVQRGSGTKVKTIRVELVPTGKVTAKANGKAPPQVPEPESDEAFLASANDSQPAEPGGDL
jgi:hypothetical protein